VPFEIGYIFKALPEALYNSLTNEHGGEEAVKAFGQILKQTVPGGSSYFIPQLAKPAIEVGLGKSFFTGRDILTPSEQRLSPEAQYRPGTSELAKWLGQTTGVSPIKIEHAVSGYTGALGLALMQAVSAPLPTPRPRRCHTAPVRRQAVWRRVPAERRGRHLQRRVRADAGVQAGQEHRGRSDQAR
jgi:hypothetical protein